MSTDRDKLIAELEWAKEESLMNFDSVVDERVCGAQERRQAEIDRVRVEAAFDAAIRFIKSAGDG